MTDLDGVRLRLDRVCAAVGEIDPAFLDTPTLSCSPLGSALGCSVTLKVEMLNPVRSFKGRGSETVAAGARDQGASRLVCASAGNLGQALAYSGRRRGLAVTVVAARTANPFKLRRIAALGADLRLDGEDIEDARLLAREIAEADGAYLVEDSLDVATCEGAATIGLELVRDDPHVEVVLVAVGGGALASGVGCVVRSFAERAEHATTHAPARSARARAERWGQHGGRVVGRAPGVRRAALDRPRRAGQGRTLLPKAGSGNHDRRTRTNSDDRERNNGMPTTGSQRRRVGPRRGATSHPRVRAARPVPSSGCAAGVGTRVALAGSHAELLGGAGPPALSGLLGRRRMWKPNRRSRGPHLEGLPARSRRQPEQSTDDSMCKTKRTDT